MSRRIEDLTFEELIQTIDRCLEGAARASAELRRREKVEKGSRIETVEPATPETGIAAS